MDDLIENAKKLLTLLAITEKLIIRIVSIAGWVLILIHLFH